MSTTDQATFALDRFEWTAARRLEVAGRWWSGLEGQEQATPVLALRAGGRVHQLPPIPESVGGSLASGKRWHAVFAWDGEPAEIEGAELAIGSHLVIELPAPRSSRRRFGRLLLPVREVAGEEPAATAASG